MIRPFWPALNRLVNLVLAQQKREEVHAGVTNGSGDYTVVFDPAFPSEVVPHVTPVMIPQSDSNRSCRVTSASNTGFTIRVDVRSSQVVLGFTLLTAEPTPVSGAALSVRVREP